MSISSTTNRVKYTGDNATSVFSYGCRIFANTELKVTKRLIASPFTETGLVLTTDYTVDGIGNSTGNVTLVAGALANTFYLVIRRVRPLTQTTSIRNSSKFYASTHEDTFDQIVMQVQQLQDQISRAMILPETFTSADLNPQLPLSLPGAVSCTIATDPTGTSLVLGPTVSAISGASASAAAASASAAAAAVSAANAALASLQLFGTKAAPYLVVAGTTIPIAVPNGNMVYFIKGNAGAVVSSATPAIAAGSATGQRLVLWGCDNTNTVTLSDQASVPSCALDLNGLWVANNGAKLELIWDNGSATWSELSRSER